MKTENKNHKKIYEDVLIYSTSLNKEPQSLTYWEATLLRKLIHISFKKEVITYSNENLAKLLFRPDGTNTVKNTISKLVSKGFITSVTITLSDGQRITKRRTIMINWETIEKIHKSLPDYFIEEPEDNTNEEPKELPQVESSNESDIQVPQEVETPADSLEIDKSVVTHFINNYGKSINIYLENVDFFNDVILKDKDRFDILKEVGYTDEEVNEALYFEKTITN